MKWTQEAMDTLARMWGEGLEASAIGKTLGCSKSAVLGKRNRMGLPERGSPLHKPKPAGPSEEHRFAVLQEPLRMCPLVPPEGTYRHQAPLSLPPSMGCQWPIGDPLKPDFRFCEGRRIRLPDGTLHSYCAVHYPVAVVRTARVKI